LQAQSPEFKSQPPQKTKKRKRTMKGRMERKKGIILIDP
jgi:hypothetical protein